MILIYLGILGAFLICVIYSLLGLQMGGPRRSRSVISDYAPSRSSAKVVSQPLGFMLRHAALGKFFLFSSVVFEDSSVTV